MCNGSGTPGIRPINFRVLQKINDRRRERERERERGREREREKEREGERETERKRGREGGIYIYIYIYTGSFRRIYTFGTHDIKVVTSTHLERGIT
jgi:hypothetical protein